MTETPEFEFEPFLDYSSINDDQVKRMTEALREVREAGDQLLSNPSPANVTRVLKAQDQIVMASASIEQEILTIPVMVHEAGDRTEVYEDDEGQEVAYQRCVRCGSTLAGWRRGLVTIVDDEPQQLELENMMWHEPGAIIAKAQLRGGVRIYEIEKGQELKKHERPCVALPQIDIEGLEGS